MAAGCRMRRCSTGSSPRSSTAEAETIRAEGWKWIEVAVDFPYGHASGLRRLAGETRRSPNEEQATCDALRAEYDELEAEYADADELPDEVDQRLGEIETALEAFEDTAGDLRSGRHRPRRRRSSASIPTASCGSSAAMSVPRTRRRPNPRGDVQDLGASTTARRPRPALR